MASSSGGARETAPHYEVVNEDAWRRLCEIVSAVNRGGTDAYALAMLMARRGTAGSAAARRGVPAWLEFRCRPSPGDDFGSGGDGQVWLVVPEVVAAGFGVDGVPGS